MPKSRSKRVRRQPPPKAKPRRSPPAVPALLFTFLACGIVVIIGNYVALFGTSDNARLWYGLGLMLAGLLVATQWH